MTKLAQDHATAKDPDIEDALIHLAVVLPIATLPGISLHAITTDLAAPAPAPQTIIGLTLTTEHETPASTDLQKARSHMR
ncbi:uncharacterized protein N7483_012135 [Penicillium malachiteum]|uniref:uncharacterized protein n=1 Tax=Penicillium malachiteum TaxID=1324776 RepID=UPI00254679C9|nr:uncharacterized protein N7483_012135 [Penicillium malachiteum]KAJ5714954.1 hypothetical protein N7483_012135 [Penicillium malachiteum]